MGTEAHHWLVFWGTGLAVIAASYGLLAWLATARWRRVMPAVRRLPTPSTTVLKPLCGAEAGLYDSLRSFCDQDYPSFQVVFGVRDPADPAVAVVERLRREFPWLDLAMVVDSAQHGSNRKVSNLINMLACVRHEHIVIADSDVWVPRNYLAGVTAPLSDPDVGIVTCAYRGRPRPGLPSLLGALFINDWFMPSVYVAALGGSRAFAFGATVALRRSVLHDIGGFEAIANQLADDYRLGELTRRRGLQTVLSEVVVDTGVDERSLGDLARHELRWLRTIRAVRPVGFALSGITFSVPLALLGTLVAEGGRPALTMLGIAVFARVMLHWSGRQPGSGRSHLWALPLSDVFSLAMWCWSFSTRRVHWRNESFRVARDGSAQPIP